MAGQERPTAGIAHDPYAFPPQLADFDLHLFGEGRHWHAYRFLGSHIREVDGVAGVQFAVWAPNATRVSVVGDFNDWDGRAHPMRVRGGTGVWELFIPAITAGGYYKYEIRDQAGYAHVKIDPYANAFQNRPQTAGFISPPSDFTWTDADWMRERAESDWQRRPFSVYEVHLGSWKRDPNGDLHQLPRACRGPRRLRRGARLHPCGAPADHRAPAGRLLGLSVHGLFRAHQPLRLPGRLPLLRRSSAPARDRRAARLGSGALSQGRLCPGALRRLGALRACGPATR